ELKFDRASGDAGLPVLYVTRQVASWLLQSSGQNLDALQDSIDATKQPRSFLCAEAQAQLEAEVILQRREAVNVIGMLAGSAAPAQKQAIIIGAHYDHLGRSSEGALDPDRVNEIHNGADDNASGTSGVLELAQYFAAPEHRPKRALIFIAFAGEELGLLGSAHYVNKPTFPLEQTVAMINLDMIGRVQDSALVVQGVGTSPNFTELVQRNNAETKLKLSLKKDGLGPSDHSSFYQKNLPVLFFFSGLHGDYHRVSDDADKINASGEAQVLNLVAKISAEIANSDSLPLFTKVDSGEQQQARGFRVSVGTIPDYAAEVEGMKLSGVRAGGPAERAGLQAGDVIIRFGKFEVKNVYDYTYALADFSPGDEVEVVVLRKQEKKTMKIKLEAGRR
ncbi:MAG: M28 family peptidase, partial [candidate division KSB1 bacterium]